MRPEPQNYRDDGKPCRYGQPALFIDWLEVLEVRQVGLLLSAFPVVQFPLSNIVSVLHAHDFPLLSRNPRFINLEG